MVAVSRKKSENSGSIDFDDLLPHAGEFGLYQVLLIFVMLPFYAYFAFIYYGQIFMTEPTNDHWCSVPELGNFSVDERRHLSLPIDETTDSGYSSCLVFDANWTEVVGTKERPGPNASVIKCPYRWEYNRTKVPYETITTELDWVCDRDNYPATAQSLFFVGSVIGSLILGWVSDKYGRIPVTVLANLVAFVGGIASSFASNFWQFSLTRMIVGMGYDNCVMMMYILVLEYTAPKYRTAITNGTFAVFYTLMSCLLPWIAVAADGWRLLAIVISCPFALALMTPLLVPESPRWLLSKGRVEDAIDKLNRIAKVNKKVVPEKILEDFRASIKSETATDQTTMADMLKNRWTRKTFILICLAYMLASIGFDCLVRIMGHVGGDFFVSFTVASLTELPSLILLIFIMDFLGRKWMTALCFLITCVFVFIYIFLPKGPATLTCIVIARFVMNLSFNGVIQWAPELMPSSVRGSGTAFVHICGYLATIISPYIIYSETVASFLPPLIISALSAVGFGLSLFIPETAGKPMPQTCHDAELMARSQRVWEFPFVKKQNNADSAAE